MVKPERPQMTIWRMHVSCWMSKATRAQTQALAPPLTHPHTHARTRLIVTLYVVYIAPIALFSRTSTPGLGFAQLPLQWALCLSSGVVARA
jgi:hypothetical protein